MLVPLKPLGRSQGTPFYPAPVPQPEAKTTAAVCWAVTPPTPEGK